jgi:hypothetical protein
MSLPKRCRPSKMIVDWRSRSSFEDAPKLPYWENVQLSSQLAQVDQPYSLEGLPYYLNIHPNFKNTNTVHFYFESVLTPRIVYVLFN